MEANDPRDVANLDTRGMIGRINEGYHKTFLRTKYIFFRPCGFREKDFFHIFPIISQCYIMMAPGAWPIWAPGIRLAGFMKGVTKH